MRQERPCVSTWLGSLLGHPEPFPVLGDPWGGTGVPTKQAGVGSWGRHASRGSRNIVESAPKVACYRRWNGCGKNPLAALDAVMLRRSSSLCVKHLEIERTLPGGAWPSSALRSADTVGFPGILSCLWPFLRAQRQRSRGWWVLCSSTGLAVGAGMGLAVGAQVRVMPNGM